MGRTSALTLALCLAGCTPAGQGTGGIAGQTASRTALPLADTPMPRLKSFGAQAAPPPVRSNADMARDFLDLHFALESGSRLPVMTRFEGPIALQLTGRPAPTLLMDLQHLLTRLRREAGIDIQIRTNAPVQGAPQTAQITLESVSRAQIQKALPQAACFVVPNVSSLEEYRRKRSAGLTSWDSLRQRSHLAIFVPNDVSPQELRDCLHEELAQALGPLNDLYRLPDSVFNDDNVHTVLTGFDMLMLRATYAPELRSGMGQNEVAARLPALLARLNPAGQRRRSAPLPATPRRWISAIETALGGGGSSGQSPAGAAHRAAAIARDLGWQDHRRAFSHFLLGRAEQAANPNLALAHFRTARSYLQPGQLDAPMDALIITRMAAAHISRANPAKALPLTAQAIATARENQNAALLATALLLRAQALDELGRANEAEALRRESLGWSRYGFGPDWAVRARQRDIAALAPPRRRR